MTWTPFLGLAATMALLLLVERWIHRHLQGVMMLLTGDPEIAVMLYALPLLPGIIVHELSHALAAVLLGIRVGRISIRPKRAGERIQLGFVPIEKTDAVRATLIGLAPLIAGCITILLTGYLVFGLDTIRGALIGSDWVGFLAEIARALRAPDAWIWAYVVFSVSNTMLPSRADRQAWGPVILFLLLIGAAIWLVGLGPTIIAGLANPLTIGVQWLTTMCAITVTIDLPFALLIAMTEKVLERVKGYQIDYVA
jgi:hypothetical protein